MLFNDDYSIGIVQRSSIHSYRNHHNTQIQVNPTLSTSKQITFNHHLLPSPILSSLDRTIRALSPGKGFSSSFGSYFLVVNSLSMYSGWPPPLPPPPSRLSSSFLRRRASSKAVMSSGVIVIAVGFRRSIFFFLSFPLCLSLCVCAIFDPKRGLDWCCDLTGGVRGLYQAEIAPIVFKG